MEAILDRVHGCRLSLVEQLERRAPSLEHDDPPRVGAPVGDETEPQVRLALEVPNSDDTARRLIEAGGAEVAPPVLTPWGDRNARVRAPDGMQLTLFTTAE